MQIFRYINRVFTIALGCLISLACVASIALGVAWHVLFRKSCNCEVHSPKHPTAQNLVLECNLSGTVVESIPINCFCSEKKGMVELKVLQKSIREASADNRIQAIYLKLSNLSAGWAALEEIRESLLAFKQAGKSIVAYGESYTHASYYLASLADEIILNPSGYFSFQGLSITVHFYPKLLEKLALKPVIFRIGGYKDAVEPLSANKMSQESRDQRMAYLSSIYNQFLTKVSAARCIPVATLKEYAHNLAAVLPNDSLQANLITKVGYESDAKALLKQQLSKFVKDGNPSYVRYCHYASAKRHANVNRKKNCRFGGRR